MLSYFQSTKMILGPSDTWLMRRSTQQPSIWYWRLSDFYLINLSVQTNLFLCYNLSRSSCSCCTIIIWPFGGIINLTRNLLTDLWWNIINDTMLCHQKLAACLCCWTVRVDFFFSIAWNTYMTQGDHFSPSCRRCFSVFSIILMDKTRNIGICRCMDVVQTHKCSLLIMGLHIFQIKLC